MRKRLLAIVLVLGILTSMLPVTAAATTTDSDRALIQAQAEELLREHAQKVYQTKAADDAFTDFFVHALFGNHHDMILNDSSAQTACLFNTELLQDGLSRMMTEAVIAAMETNEPLITSAGAISWHNYGYDYYSHAYVGDYSDTIGSIEYAEMANKMVKGLVNTKDVYNVAMYPGPRNRNDETQELLSGSAYVTILVRPLEIKNGSAVYQLDININDEFDFEGDYNKLSDKYDTSKDSRLKRLGLLMTTLGIDEFYWEYTKTFTMEVPYTCDHSSTAFHWKYDSASSALLTDGTEGYSLNTPIRKVYRYTPKDAQGVKVDERTFYGLENTVRLDQNKPWVIECEWTGGGRLQMSPYETGSTPVGVLYFYSNQYICMTYSEVEKLPQGQKTEDGKNSITHFHYVGVQLNKKFDYNAKHTYRYILENAVNADGSNAVYASVYDCDLDEVVFGPETMDDHWVKYSGDTTTTLLSEHDGSVFNKDIYVNFVGTNSIGITGVGDMELYIFENGKETLTESSLTHGHVAPTCTEQGYTVYTCHCGDTYKADYTVETGHSPVIDAAVPASCIGNGLTEGSHCQVCGYVIKAQNTVIGGTHLKDDGTIIKEATYETPGTVMYQCIYCGEKSYVVLPKLDKPEPVVNPFTDVKESDWFYAPVMWAVQSGVTGGKTATTFAPNEGCTRAQVVTFLWAANGKPMPETTDNPFTDIKEGDWYYNAVLWAVENGITGGTSEHTFSPNATCTRAQIATFLWAAQGKHAVSNLSGFSDVAVADWYATPVIWAKEQGITGGIGDGKFGPNQTCTRAQVVTFLYKVYGDY